AAAMLRTPTFYVLWVAYAMGTIAGTMVISQLVPFALAAWHSAAVAAFALTVGAIGSASGRVLSGWLSDRFGRLNTIRALLVVSACAMPALFLLRENVAAFYLFLGLVYYCYGTQLSVYASTSADFLGKKNVWVDYWLLLLAWGASAVFGPTLGGRVFVVTGEYRWAFFIGAALSVAALVTLIFARPPQARPAAIAAGAQL